MRPRWLYCLNCGSQVSWRALWKQKWWKHTACPSCEGYVAYMCDPKHLEEGSEW